MMLGDINIIEDIENLDLEINLDDLDFNINFDFDIDFNFDDIELLELED